MLILPIFTLLTVMSTPWEPAKDFGQVLVETHDPADTLYQTIDDLARQVDPAYLNPFQYQLSELLAAPREERSPTLSQSAKAFAQFYKDNAPAFQEPKTNRARRPLKSDPIEFQYMGYHRRLILALILEADDAYQMGHPEQGQMYLHHAAKLAAFHSQNTDLSILMVARDSYQRVAEYILNHLPKQYISEEMTSWFPTWDTHKTAMNRALYVEYVRIVDMYKAGIVDEFQRKQASVGEEPSALMDGLFSVMSFFALDVSETIGLLKQNQRDYQNMLEGPLARGFQSTLPEPSDDVFFGNKLGEELTKTTERNFESYLYQLGMIDVAKDAVAVHIALSQANLAVSKENTQRIVSEQHLTNVFTGAPYAVDGRGRLILLTDSGVKDVMNRCCPNQTLEEAFLDRRLAPLLQYVVALPESSP